MVAAVDVSPAQDGGILKEITVEGSSDATPAFGSEVKKIVHQQSSKTG